MHKREIIRQFAHNREDEILLGRLLDLAERSQKGYAVYSKFLNPHERSIALKALHHCGYSCCMDGGYDEAERVVAAFLPEYLTTPRADAEFPVCLLEVCVQGKGFGRELTHRDYLGALMGLQIQREMIGDILQTKEGAQLFVLKQAAPVILEDLHKAGSKSVVVRQLPLSAVRAPGEEKQAIHGFVASMRLDAIVAEGFSLSRSKAVQAIEAGMVYLQHIECTRPAQEVQSGDVIALRGNGRLSVGEPGGMSRKGRLSITLYKWK